MIKATVKELLDSRQAFSELLEIELPAPSAYKIARLAKVANEELSTVQDSLNSLSEKYVDKEKGEFKDKKSKEEYSKELKDLMGVEVEINADKLAVSILDEAKIRSAILLSLVWVFEE